MRLNSLMVITSLVTSLSACTTVHSRTDFPHYPSETFSVIEDWKLLPDNATDVDVLNIGIHNNLVGRQWQLRALTAEEWIKEQEKLNDKNNN